MELIDRKSAINAVLGLKNCYNGFSDTYDKACIIGVLEELPSAEPKPHYCRECKWSRCRINIGKHGEIETYWRCLNWDGGTDEEGFCHEWERRTDETD